MKAPLTGSEFEALRYLDRPRSTHQLNQFVKHARQIVKSLLARGFLERVDGAGVVGNPYRYKLSRIGAVLLSILESGK